MNSAGAPEIIDTNNYYPFGLSHTGGNGLNSSHFGSFNSYKYNGKELQETGMFDYGWRQYLPDLGRWNGIDQLAEAYTSTSPYAYVANNPVSQYDVDGRWFNQDGTIDTSGRTPGFTTGRQYYYSFLGIDPNYSEGGGESTGNTNEQSSAGGGNSSGSGKGFDGETINIPEVVLSGKSSLMFGLKLRNWVNAYMKEWNIQNNPNFLYNIIGDQVLPAIPSSFARLWALFTGRTWKDGNGLSYNVNVDGIATGITPITGDVPIGQAGSFNILKAYKSGLSLFKGGSLTNIGRAVTKHPQYFGFESTEALMKVFRNPNAINKLGSDMVKDILRNGGKSTGAGGRYPQGWVTFTLPNGNAASWSVDGVFIGFRGLK